MCGIAGVFGTERAPELLKIMLDEIAERGRDGSGASSEKETFFSRKRETLRIPKSKNLIGHNLHAVVGHIPQPIRNKGILVANCEIYNWKELNKKYNFKAKNDAEVLLKLLDKKGTKALEELDGDYAFAYWNRDKLIVARDVIGVKPVWYSKDKAFCFASEKKALEAAGCQNIYELNPRMLLEYNLKTEKLKQSYRGFFNILPEHKKGIKEKTKQLLLDSIKKRLPEGKFGILFSGGVDSTLLALICKNLKRDFVCYTAALSVPGLKEAEDEKYAKKIAKELKLKLKIKHLSLNDVKKLVKKVVPLIEDYNAIKTGVAVTLYAACEMAKKDKIKVILTGLGSEQIFAGYEKHKRATNLNQECLSGIRTIYEKDTYRDDVVTMRNNLEARVPYLDLKLVKYALKIPPEMKINKQANKAILREIAIELGLKEEFAMRKKKAAQYGSKIDYAIKRLAKRNNAKSRTDYLQQFYKKENVRLGALFSSGKDSTYALYTMQRQGYPVKCLIAMISKNPDSWMFHTPNIKIAKYQAEALDIPLIEQETTGKKEEEIKDLKKALKRAIGKYKIEGIITGAIFSTYQRNRIEQACDELGLKIFSPLWHMHQESLVKNMINEGFEIIISSIAADGLSKKWLGRKLDNAALKELEVINEEIGINIGGEGGEYESLVLNAPNFKRKLKIEKAEVKMSSECTGSYIIKKVKLLPN